MIQEDPTDGPAASSIVDPGSTARSPLLLVGVEAMPAGVDGGQQSLPAVSDAELAQLHVRVIALEGLLAALLVDASDAQIGRVRAMAAYISPRPGNTAHPLTERASGQMEVVLERARRFGELAGNGQPRPGDQGC